MSDGHFTTQAAVLWNSIPREARERILKNVFCVKCCGPAEMIEFSGREKHGDIILTGSCAKCGHKVVRVVETSEQDLSGN
jgi:hypothetical protein